MTEPQNNHTRPIPEWETRYSDEPDPNDPFYYYDSSLDSSESDPETEPEAKNNSWINT